MVQAWWPHAPQTFDGPAWSVSIEVLLYLVFFAACRTGLRAGWPSFAVAGLGIPLLWIDEHIARGVMGFFMGGTAFAVWRQLRVHAASVTITRTLGALALALWAVLALLLWQENALVGGGETNVRFLLVFDLLLCPLTVLALALHESTTRRSYARAAFLGDISYATYLLHFPVQLALVVVAVRLGVAPAFFMQGWVLIAFYAALIGLGAAVYYGFEKPMQDWLRGRKPAQAVAVID
jgi:peptidoglycan/LPS O-acetylase OafA/YrhL